MTGQNSLTRTQEWTMLLVLALPQPWAQRWSEALLRRWGYS